MKKILIVVVGVIILGVGYWLLSPLFLKTTVREALPAGEQSQTILQGSFHDVIAGHHAKGTAKLIKVDSQYIIRFEDDFEVTNGPDLVVYLGKNNQYDPKGKLAELKGSVGSQNYEIPADVDVTQYDEVWVWCRSFSVPFGAAKLSTI